MEVFGDAESCLSSSDLQGERCSSAGLTPSRPGLPAAHVEAMPVPSVTWVPAAEPEWGEARKRRPPCGTTHHAGQEERGELGGRSGQVLHLVLLPLNSWRGFNAKRRNARSSPVCPSALGIPVSRKLLPSVQRGGLGLPLTRRGEETLRVWCGCAASRARGTLSRGRPSPLASV